MNWCCQTWLDLGKELSDLKVSSLDKLVKKGIPRSTFSPVFRILDAIDNFCPMCGFKINKNTPSETVRETVVEPPKAPKSADTVKCPPCRGTGKVGDGLNCMTCLGSGKLDRGNPMRAKFDPVFAQERAETLERNSRKIVAVEKEIERNPKPMREDAKPEAWGGV